MKFSIFLKTFIIIAFILLTVFISIPYFIFSRIKEHYIDTLSTQLKNFEYSLVPEVTVLLKEQHYQKLNIMLKQLSKDTSTRITVVDPEGIVIADSYENPARMENHKGRPEIAEALSTGTGKALRFSPTFQQEMLYVAMLIKDNDRILGVVRASIYLKEINKLLEELDNKILHIILAIGLLSLLAAFLFSRMLTKPIKLLADSSRAIGEGNFDVRLFFKRNDELKELADNFNFMASQIQSLFAELSHQKEELNSLITSMQEGLVVIDEKAKIQLCNESFKTIVDNSSIEQKHYWEIIRNAEFDELIKRTRETNTNLTKDIELNNKVYLCSTSLLSLKKEILVILHDITEMKNMEKLKKDLIDNVSHELRTPLTAIKGFVDTLQDNADEKNKRYIDIIARNTERLTKIVQDLLMLSSLEAKEISLEYHEVNLKILLEDLLLLFQPKASNKGLSLTLELPDAPPVMKGDSFKLEQMFINLIENAINYTEKGEINISIAHHDNFIKIEIKDTGIGIPSQHLSRIFERFYVVDKSRSRKYSGTGLGLSIVRHIVLLHNGDIKVSSSSAGTLFTILLPK